MTSHVRLARAPEALHATRIASGEADALIGCDLIVAAGDECLSKLKPDTRAVIDADLIPTSEFARNPNWSVDKEGLIERLKSPLADRAFVVDGQRLAKQLLGDAIASNMFMLGAAWQKGLVPVRREAIERAIELNGVAIEANMQAFEWGRRAAHDLAGVEKLVGKDVPNVEVAPSLDALIGKRADHLKASHGLAAARRYRALVNRVRSAETKAGLGEALTAAAARSYHRLLAVKDEWEVARLFAAPEFAKALAEEFEGPYKLRFHMGGWPFGRLSARRRLRSGRLDSSARHVFPEAPNRARPAAVRTGGETPPGGTTGSIASKMLNWVRFLANAILGKTGKPDRGGRHRGRRYPQTAVGDRHGAASVDAPGVD